MDFYETNKHIVATYRSVTLRECSDGDRIIRCNNDDVSGREWYDDLQRLYKTREGRQFADALEFGYYDEITLINGYRLDGPGPYDVTISVPLDPEANWRRVEPMPRASDWDHEPDYWDHRPKTRWRRQKYRLKNEHKHWDLDFLYCAIVLSMIVGGGYCFT